MSYTRAQHPLKLTQLQTRVDVYKYEICDFKNWLSFFVFFFLFSHTYKNCNTTRMPYPITLKFGTQKGGIKAHLGTNFGWNTINRQIVLSEYSRKITPICCHVYRVNRVWEEAENRWVNRLLHFIDKDINITRSLVRRMLDDASKVCMTASQRIFMARDCREWL